MHEGFLEVIFYAKSTRCKGRIDKRGRLPWQDNGEAGPQGDTDFPDLPAIEATGVGAIKNTRPVAYAL